MAEGDQPPPPIAGAVIPAAPTLKRVVVFDPATGQPVIQNVPMFTKQQVANIIVAAATELYEGDPILEPEFIGKTNLEVMVIKQTRRAAANGEMVLVEAILDRIIGKPKTTSESHSISETYEQALARIERQDAEARLRAAPSTPPASDASAPIEAQVIDPSPLGDLL